ncbi:hypothetical protein [Streptomyces sp. NPDC058872]|uniref:hypothetical protein n=1 Tax=Streptomyces sp. NPDC058872 TaxID=3346661 RepID=UPI0036CE5DD9
MRRSPLALYARSRGLPGSLAAFVVAAGAVWSTRWLVPLPEADPTARLLAVVLAPLFVAGTIGTGLHAPSEELDRTAVRAWWPRRLAHLLVVTALGAALLALAVPGAAEACGAPAAVRNTLGLVGTAAAAAAVLGARLSWLPPLLYVGAVSLAFRAGPPAVANWWGWLVQPGTAGGAWTAAAVAFAAGTTLYARRGARWGRGT